MHEWMPAENNVAGRVRGMTHRAESAVFMHKKDDVCSFSDCVFRTHPYLRGFSIHALLAKEAQARAMT